MIYVDEDTGRILTADQVSEKTGTVNTITFTIYYVYNEEIGRWEMRRGDGSVANFPIEADLSKADKSETIPAQITVVFYHKYTDEEIRQLEADKVKLDAEEEERAHREKVMEALPDRVDEVETTQDDIVLLLADIVGGAI